MLIRETKCSSTTAGTACSQQGGAARWRDERARLQNHSSARTIPCTGPGQPAGVSKQVTGSCINHLQNLYKTCTNTVQNFYNTFYNLCKNILNVRNFHKSQIGCPRNICISFVNVFHNLAHPQDVAGRAKHRLASYYRNFANLASTSQPQAPLPQPASRRPASHRPQARSSGWHCHSQTSRRPASHMAHSIAASRWKAPFR